MKLLFNLACTQPSSSGKRHGGGIYGEIVFRHIIERKLVLSAYYDSSNWFNPEILQLIVENKIELLDKQKEGSLQETVQKYGFDTLYSPLVSDEVLDVKGINVVGTIHGLRPIELSYDKMIWRYKSASLREKVVLLIKHLFPKFGYKRAYQFYNKVYSKRNFRFVMVSNHSIYTLLAYCSVFRNRTVKVFYSPSTSSKEKLQKRKFNDKYYLFVSANRWEKNCLRGIIAFDRLFSQGFLQDTKVRITGVHSQKAFKYKLQNPERFEFMGYVDDQCLEQLYHDAYGFVYPSLNEGFGYPPLEAMHYGIPCVVSPFTSISEICQGAVLYANPYSVEEIMGRILMIDDSDNHEKYASLALKQESIIKDKQVRDLDGVVDFIYNINMDKDKGGIL